MPGGLLGAIRSSARALADEAVFDARGFDGCTVPAGVKVRARAR